MIVHDKGGGVLYDLHVDANPYIYKVICSRFTTQTLRR